MFEFALNSQAPSHRIATVRPLAFSAGLFFAFRVALTYVAFQNNPASGTVVAIAGSLCLFAAAASRQLVQPGLKRESNPTLRWVFAYLALSACSLLWTTTGSLSVAFGYWSGIAADTFAVILLLRNSDVIESSEQILKGFLTASVVVAVIAWCTPVMLDLRLGDEDFLHPNAIGYVFALAALLAFYLGRSARIWTAAGLFCGITLLRTLSKASIVGFVSAAAYYTLRDVRMPRKAKAALAILTIVIIACSWGLFEAYVDIYDQGNQVETLTGRTLIWAEAIDAAVQKPLLGNGFYSFRFVVPPIGSFEAWQAHNEVLQQFFSYGIVGLIVFLALYLSLWRTIRLHRSSPFATLAAALFIFALVRGLVDTERFDLSYPLWLIALVAITLAGTRSEQLS